MRAYEPLNVNGMPMVYTCCDCGNVVYNMARHDEWHRQQIATERGCIGERSKQ